MARDTAAPADSGIVNLCTLLEIRRRLRKGHWPDDQPLLFHPRELTELLVQMANARCRRRGQERIKAQSEEAIARGTKMFLRGIGRACDGKVDADDWVHHMLLHFSTRQTSLAVAQIKALLEVALQKQPTILEELQTMFQSAMPPQPGWAGLVSALRLVSRKLWRYCTFDGMACFAADYELPCQDPDDFAREAADALGFPGVEVISYTEFMAYFLGRHEKEVALYMYDITKGNAQALSRWLPMQQLDGLWHTGLVVFGWEYYYCGSLLCEAPGLTAFGHPGRVVKLGKTLRHRTELHRYVARELKPQFTRDTYDALRNNCNHFCDGISVWLCGQRLPAEVMNQTDRFLHFPLTRAVWPVLNTCLRGNSFTSVNSLRLDWDRSETAEAEVRRCCSLDSGLPGALFGQGLGAGVNVGGKRGTQSIFRADSDAGPAPVNLMEIQSI
mmetsp:Transcript_75957/g.214948  ORF Transcript_75957/g.214948 Transcript_75957/m.214948 type:complete len:443 (-) Transcript_75957:12-1340(-)